MDCVIYIDNGIFTIVKDGLVVIRGLRNKKNFYFFEVGNKLNGEIYVEGRRYFLGLIVD